MRGTDMNFRKKEHALTLRGWSLIALALAASGCASGGLPKPEDIPELEAEVAASPGNDDHATRLGAAYVSARRYDDGKRVLAPLVERGTKNGSAYLYFGIANEELQDFTAARAAYDRYLEIGQDESVKRDIRERLTLVARKELKQQARAILEREQIVSAEPPTPRTLAILPFQFTGATEELRPLQTALADMLITDLSVTRSVVPIERVRMQALIDEMLLGQAGFSDAAGFTRAGRLLKAEHVVQGAITLSGNQQLQVQSNVLATTSRSTVGGTINAQSQIDGVFALEKQLVFDIYNRLGVTLTAAERERINENRTGNLLAFLAYGRGLEALDRGNYTEASVFFNQATQLDPQFTRAQAQRQEAVQLQTAGEVTTAEIATSGAAEATGQAVDAASPIAASSNILQQTANEVNFSPGTAMTNRGTQNEGTTQTTQNRNNGAQEAQGGQSSGVQQALKATININIRRPGT